MLKTFMAEGHFIRHVRRMRAVYAERLALLLAEARAKFNGLLNITGIEAGLQTAGWLAAGIDPEVVTAAAARCGVEVTPLSRYAKGAMSVEGLQLGFAAVNAREIPWGVENLARALEDSLDRS